MAKYYAAEEAIKMLPLIKAYCRDLKKAFIDLDTLTAEARRLSALTSINKKRQKEIKTERENIRYRIELLTNTIRRWKEELKELYITVCSVEHGRVDVPVYCNQFEALVLYCVTPDTVEESIEWHFTNESAEDARPVFENAF